MAVDNLEDDMSLILMCSSAPEEIRADPKFLSKRCVLLVMNCGMKYNRVFCIIGET